MGYRSRELTIPGEQAARVVVAGGVLYPTLVVDGEVVATWKLERRRDRVTVRLAPLAELSGMVVRRAEAEAQDVARFLGAREAILV
jgi:hypothetical protein